MLAAMPAPKPIVPPLVAAAQALEDELRHVEDLANQLERASITSEKTLQRSGALLGEAGQMHDRLAECLAALVASVETTRARQQSAFERVLVETQRVQTKNEEYRALMARFVALGARAKEVNGPVAEVMVQNESGASADDLLGALARVEQLTEEVIRDADAVAQTAKDSNWPEVARDAHSLRQSMLAARNKLSLARRSVAVRATS